MTEVIEYLRVTQDPEPQITKKYIYDLLKYNKIIRANILKERCREFRAENPCEAIEGRLLGATDYGKDSVQATHEPKAMPMSSVWRDIREQRNEAINRRFLFDAQNLEIEHLDDAVAQLHPLQHAIIIKIYYGCMSMTEARESLKGKPYMAAYEESYLENVKQKAVQRIVDIFNLHEAVIIHNFDCEDDLR